MTIRQEPLLNTQSIVRNKQKLLKKPSQDTSIFWYYRFSLWPLMKPPMTSHLTPSKSQNPDNGLKAQPNLDVINLSCLISNYILLSSLCFSHTALLCSRSSNRIGSFLSQGLYLAFLYDSSLRYSLDTHPPHCWVFP